MGRLASRASAVSHAARVCGKACTVVAPAEATTASPRSAVESSLARSVRNAMAGCAVSAASLPRADGSVARGRRVVGATEIRSDDGTGEASRGVTPAPALRGARSAVGWPASVGAGVDERDVRIGVVVMGARGSLACFAALFSRAA